MEEKAYKIDEMLPLLKNHILFFSIGDKRKKYFHYMNKKVLVQDVNSRYKISEEDFIKLYKDATFYVYDPSNQIEIDIEKDKEYYSWRQ